MNYGIMETRLVVYLICLETHTTISFVTLTFLRPFRSKKPVQAYQWHLIRSFFGRIWVPLCYLRNIETYPICHIYPVFCSLGYVSHVAYGTKPLLKHFFNFFMAISSNMRPFDLNMPSLFSSPILSSEGYWTGSSSITLACFSWITDSIYT